VTIPQSDATRLIAWYGRGRRDLPWRRTRDPYRIWVSEVMLQQTTVRAVVPYYRRFIRLFPTVRALAAARPGEVLAAWSGLGYYRRARSLSKAARIIVGKHAGRFPRRIEDALALPGVGRYTAGAILSIAYGARLPVLDGNVGRVLSRLRLVRGADSAARSRRLWRLAGELVAVTPSPGDLNQALMELGATLCTPTAPACAVCPLSRRCAARATGLQETIPSRRRVRAPIKVRAAVAVVTRDGRYLLHRRSDRDLMRGLWELPAVGRGRRSDGLRLAVGRSVATVRHSITYRRLEVSVHPARLLAEPPRGGYRFVAPAELDHLPTSSLVRKVLAELV